MDNSKRRRARAIKAREDADLTQDKLAEKADVEQSTISRLENADGVPRADVAQRLARLLNISIDALLEVDEGDEPAPEPPPAAPAVRSPADRLKTLTTVIDGANKRVVTTVGELMATKAGAR